MFQLKFCLKTFETSSLLYVSVFKCSILAIILFEYLFSIQVGGDRCFPGARGPPAPYIPRLWAFFGRNSQNGWEPPMRGWERPRPGPAIVRKIRFFSIKDIVINLPWFVKL